MPFASFDFTITIVLIKNELTNCGQFLLLAEIPKKNLINNYNNAFRRIYSRQNGISARKHAQSKTWKTITYCSLDPIR